MAMVAFALALTVLAAPPRGFPAHHPPELVGEVESRLPKWLTGAELTPLLANKAELKTYFTSTGVKAAETAPLIEAALKEQSEKPSLSTFTATRALIEYVGKRALLHLFDASGNVCEVALFAVGTETAQRYVVVGPIRTFARSFDDDAKALKEKKEMLVFLEKTDGAWNTSSLPTPPPPDCATSLNGAMKTIFAAEKAYFAEHDAYTGAISKLGLDLKALGVTSAKVSVAGHAPQQTFVIQVARGSTQMTMDEKGAVTVIVPCPEK